MNTIIQYVPSQCKNYFNQKAASTRKDVDFKSLQTKSRIKSKKPLYPLQYIILLLIRDDCRKQGYSDRKVKELANMSGYSVDGVKKALKVLNELEFIFTKKGGGGRPSIRAISREGISYNPGKFRKNNKKAPLKASLNSPTLYKISYSKKDYQDLLNGELIKQMTKRESECFSAIGLKEVDELIVLQRIKRSQLSPEERLRLANGVMASHYKHKTGIHYPKAYYLSAIANLREGL